MSWCNDLCLCEFWAIICPDLPKVELFWLSWHAYWGPSAEDTITTVPKTGFFYSMQYITLVW